MKPSADALRAALAAIEHLDDDGLPPYPPRRPWPPPLPAAGDGPLWVFGYGSLMWHPGFPWREAVIGRLHGHHRALCVWSSEYRGTVRAPGLVLGLDRGGSCVGVAFRVPGADRDATVAYLLRRELTTGVYRARYRTVTLADGRRVQALAFLVDRDEPLYAGRLSLAQLVAVVSRARGRRGTNAQYVRSTVAHLDELGIPCRRLHRVAAAL